MIMHWPSFTATIEPFEMMLSSPLVFELRPFEEVRFWPFTASVFSSSKSESQ